VDRAACPPFALYVPTTTALFATLRTAALLLLCSLATPAQPPTFTSNTQLVVELVTVRTKDGKPVEGLTARDFTLTEDGKPQTIRFCEYQRLDASAPALLASAPALAPEKPGDLRYRHRRLLALYFDQSATPLTDQLRALDSASAFLRSHLSPADLVAVFSYSRGAVRLQQDFTADPAALQTALHSLANSANAAAFGEDDTSDQGSAFGQDYGEFNIFNTDRQLAGLQTVARMLEPLQEKKALVYFAAGLRLRGVDNQAQLRATINAAVRANVAFFTVDARGLVAEAPLGDATVGSSGGASMYTGEAATARAASFARSQDTLWPLSADTGGRALLDSNDLAQGIRNAQRSITSYYALGYYTSNEAQDGRFRRIHITLANEASAQLEYRTGYWAGKRFAEFTASDKERQLEEALMLGDPVTELTIALELNYFQLNRAEYYVPVSVKIPGNELVLARKRGAEHTLIDFIGEIKDELGVTVSNVRDKVDIRLAGQTAAQLASRHIQYDTGFTLLPGEYSLKFLARDAETGRIGTYLIPFTIPNLNKVADRLPLSSVVLSSQLVEWKDALFTAGKPQAQQANPLAIGDRKFLLSVTRVFSRTRDLYLYAEAYRALGPATAYLTFYQAERKVFETQPLILPEPAATSSKAQRLRLRVPLTALAPGRYECQLTVLDPAGPRAAFWQAPVKIVP
jgi:VWFA-related protein